MGWEDVGACPEPVAPCFMGWMTAAGMRVVRRSGERTRGVALTIDDVPRDETRVEDVYLLMNLLRNAGAHATFFVIFEKFHKASAEVQRVFMQRVKADGHEGPTQGALQGHTPDARARREQGRLASMHFAQRCYDLEDPPRANARRLFRRGRR